MDERDKLCIRINFKFLVDNIRVVDIGDFLYSKGVLNEDHMEELSRDRITDRNAVRKLLRVLPTRGPKTFRIFCESLRECAYPGVADKLEQMDVEELDKESLDEVDQFVAEDAKFAELQRQLWLQTEVIKKFQNDMQTLQQKVLTSEEEASKLRDKQSQMELALNRSLLSDENIKAYLRETSFHGASHSYYDAQDAISAAVALSPADPTKEIAMFLSKDIVTYIVYGEASAKLPADLEKYATTLRRLVNELLTRNEATFREFVSGLKIEEIKGFSTFTNVLDEVFSDGQCNWGRIVALYAFGSYFAKSALENGLTSLAEMMGGYLGVYVSKNRGQWIEDNGGWDGFVEYFPRPEGDASQTPWKSILLLGAGAGALLGLVTVRGSTS